MGKTREDHFAIILLAIAFFTYAIILILTAPHEYALWVNLSFAFLQTVLMAICGHAVDTTRATSLFQSYPSLTISAICSIVQYITGGMLAYVLPHELTVSLVLGIILFAFCLTAFLLTRRSIRYALAVENDLKRDTSFMNNLLLALRDIQAEAQLDEKTSASLNRLIEAVRFSDVRSNAFVQDIEAQIQNELDDISAAHSIDDKDIDKLYQLVGSRSRKLKASKS